jgi:hypothetical protein
VQLKVQVSERLQKQKNKMGSLNSHLKSMRPTQVAMERLGD